MIITGDCRDILPQLPSNSVDCVVTSPPYYQLRDYGVTDQIGMETTPEQYVNELVSVFREVRRVLNPSGTLWLNLGDSYVNPSHADGGDPTIKKRNLGGQSQPPPGKNMLRGKNLLMIPARVAIALQSDGWILRQDIIWNKPNAMPESVKDRCTKSHEYLYLFAKEASYYFDSDGISESISPKTKSLAEKSPEECPRYGGKKYTASSDIFFKTKSGNAYKFRPFRNKRSVWTIPTQRFDGAHFATFPPELVEPCIVAGCPMGGTVLDPFCGSGTVGMVAHNLGREFIGIELNQEYVKIAEKRVGNTIQTNLKEVMSP